MDSIHDDSLSVSPRTLNTTQHIVTPTSFSAYGDTLQLKNNEKRLMKYKERIFKIGCNPTGSLLELAYKLRNAHRKVYGSPEQLSDPHPCRGNYKFTTQAKAKIKIPDINCETHGHENTNLIEHIKKPLSEQELQAIVDSAVDCVQLSNHCGAISEITTNSEPYLVEPENIQYIDKSAGRKHQCGFCDYKTDNRSHMRRHESTVHSLFKPYKCNICHKEFSRSEKVKSHFLKTHPSNRYDSKLIRKNKSKIYSTPPPLSENTQYQDSRENKKGSDCKARSSDPMIEFGERESFASSSRYIYTIETMNKFQCSKCDFRTRDIWHLKGHIADVHHPVKEYRCPLCSYATNRRHRAISHMKDHGEMFCFICAFSSTDVEMYRKHVHLCCIVHDSNKTTYTDCMLCKECCESNIVLKEHCAKHHNIILYACNVCNFYDASESELDSHKENHEHNVDNVYCEKCIVFFASDDEYFKHFKSCHYNEQNDASPNRIDNLDCNMCDFSAITKKELCSHLTTHANKQMECEFNGCSFKAILDKSMETHKKNIHGFPAISKQNQIPSNLTSVALFRNNVSTEMVCPVCGIQFKYRKSFFKHVSNHKEEEEKCPLCKEIFYLRVNLKKHLQEFHDADVVEVSSSSDEGV